MSDASPISYGSDIYTEPDGDPDTLANLGGFLGPYAVGVLKERSGGYQQGLLLLALISLAGAVLALWLRRSPVLSART